MSVGNTYTVDITPDGGGNIRIDVPTNVPQDISRVTTLILLVMSAQKVVLHQ